MKYPQSIQSLIEHFSKLPTVGPKTAERFVFNLLKKSPGELYEFGEALKNLKKELKTCSQCLSISLTDPCDICAKPDRSTDLLCLVATFQDLLSIESTGQYQGRYFILGGLLDTIENVQPADLNIKLLVNRINELIKNGQNLEIILALSPTVEGESTGMYLAKLLSNPKIKISKLARGLPSGSNLEYADETTLKNALKYRQNV
jgi:recombination protein RecR